MKPAINLKFSNSKLHHSLRAFLAPNLCTKYSLAFVVYPHAMPMIDESACVRIPQMSDFAELFQFRLK